MINKSQRPLLKAAAIVAYEHHEKWDGSGYPQGLSAEEIHIYGRITAVADVFDALGSDRVYKKAWPDEKIFNLLKEERGKHFDPRLVDLFFEHLETMMQIRAQFSDTFKEVHKERDEDTIKILGAYGTKAKGYGTSTILLNPTNVIDAGNLLEGLAEDSVVLENIWITHSHLDHISDIAYILDNYFHLRTATLTIIGLPATIQTIKENYFNNTIWPDFSQIKLANGNMVIEYKEIHYGEVYTLSPTETIKPYKTDHIIDSCGYIYKKNDKAILISSDTYSLRETLNELQADTTIKSAIIECSFPSDMEQLAIDSKHLTPKLLFRMLDDCQRDDFQLYINHIKPLFLDTITQEIEVMRKQWNPIIVKDGDSIVL